MTERPPLPPNQHLAAPGKWPLVGERAPAKRSDPWTVSVAGEVARPRVYGLDELRAMESIDRPVDVHCVTRWSKLGMAFTGVSLAALVDASQPKDSARFVSFVARSEREHSTSLALGDALDLETMIAWRCEGEPLAVEHGGPVRVVVPGRYFYKSLKWLERIELLSEDRLGYWEREAGYHNTADPWREERYLLPAISRQAMQAALASRDFAGRDLRSIAAAGHDLAGLDARRALLRDADFRGCVLREARFDGANLSNAHFQRADLRQTSFAKADLEGADFGGADLRGADFRGASLFGATFRGEDIVHDDNVRSVTGARLDESTTFDQLAVDQLAPPEAEYVAQSAARIVR